mmetsp:Transcript_88119/g.139257  ORF Transcript_88119/g.139257 Transcript_88119/m.139257 type:complete len:671 (+) Transcript_88119:120-2132(+)
MMNLSTLFGSVHFTAFVLGAALYLGYLLLPYLRLLVQPISQIGFSMQRKEDDLSEASCASAAVPSVSKPSRRITLRQAAFGGAILSLLAALAFSSGAVEQVSTTCPSDMEDPLVGLEPMAVGGPAEGRWRNGARDMVEGSNVRAKLRSPGAWKFIGRPGGSSTLPALPSELLGRAHAAVDRSGSNEASDVLEACVEWSPAADGDAKPLAPVPELHAQLGCIGELIDSSSVALEASSALVSKGRKILAELHSRGDESSSVLQSAEVQWARIIHAVFQSSCQAATGEITTAAQQVKAARGSAIPASINQAFASLSALRRLEAPLRESLAALTQGEQIIAHQASERGNETVEDLQEMQAAIASDRACAVRALQEGRSLALVLPKNAPLVRKMVICRPRMFQEFEDFVVSAASQARDAATRFGLGLYFSDIGLAIGQGQAQAPFFGRGPTSRSWSSSEVWSEDAEGLHAPGELVEAEALLLDGEEASMDSDRGERAAARALRLYQHAKLLALKHHDGAAEWRYLTSAKLAASHHRQKLAAHALGRLGYFLSLRGRKTEALEMIDQSLKHGEDPLAQYLQASLRRSLGELKSTEDITSAEKQLSLVAGQLPSKLLEEQRAAAHAQIAWWRLVGTQGMQVCLKAWDAAQFLICMFCGFLFDLPQAAAIEAITEDVQ